MWIIAIFLLTALAMPAGLAAQSAPGYNQRVLYTFTETGNGTQLYGDLIQDEQGNLYGTSYEQGDPTCKCGAAFKLDPAGNFTVLHAFTGDRDGAFPRAGLTSDSNGNLYGTTSSGGNGYGTVFKIDAEGHESILYSFGGADGNTPYGGIYWGSDGSLYGTTNEGGNLNDCSGAGCGVVFKLDPSNHFSQLYVFQGVPDGAGPSGPLTRDANGCFDSTTTLGGTSNHGTVYRLCPDEDGTWTEIVLYSFTGGADGNYPASGVILDPNGNLYGTAEENGLCGYCGVVFKIDSTGHESTFYAFTGGTDGAFLAGGLVRDSQGNLYGAAGSGGNQTQWGTVYMLDPSARETTLYSFSGLSDGGNPGSTLVRDHNGNLFGNTVNGGTPPDCGGYGCGVIFEISACPTANCRMAK